MSPRSLGFRLVAWYAGVLTVVFVLLGALTFLVLRHNLETNVLDVQARRAHQIAGTLLAAVARTGEAAVGQEVQSLYSPEANDRFIRITRRDGRVLYASGKPRDSSFDPSIVPLPAHRRSVSGEVQVSSGAPLLIASVSYPRGAGARYFVEVGVSAARIRHTLDQFIVVLVGGLPVAVMIVVAGGFLLVKRALQPVERLARKAEAITQHNLSDRLPVVHTGDELERLSTSLNLMISRLEDTVQNSKRLVADVSHELRTPLSVLRSELESLMQEWHLRPQARETLGSMLEEVQRLGQIVEALLALSRLDAGEARAEWVTLDLADLAATTADQMSLMAEDKRISVTCEAAQRVEVVGDRARLKQVIVNLLDNAIKYTPTGGAIRLQVQRDNGYAILDVSDSGVGIPPEALPHVFERFYRVDGSRSREQGGVGLGLSIVKSICMAHNAEVHVRSTPGWGSHFRIQGWRGSGERRAATGPARKVR